MNASILFSLAGYFNPRCEIPAICVPFFVCKQDNYSYVQIVGTDHVVLAMERVESSEWEPAIGSYHEELYAEEGEAAIYWIILAEGPKPPLIGTHSKIKGGLFKSRMLIDEITNPFERLDFAQLTQDKTWFAQEAYTCEQSLAVKDHGRAMEWVRESLLKARALHELETIARRRQLPAGVRRRLAARLSLRVTNDHLIVEQDPLSSIPGHATLTGEDLSHLQAFVDEDFVCQYAHRRLIGRLGFAEESVIESTAADAFVSPILSTPDRQIRPESAGWWRAATDLDNDQTRAYQWPLDGCYLLQGPPGSGKTNILVLRASYVASTGQSNVRLITYTRVLREFIAAGCGDNINFPASQVMTVAGWINEFLSERGMDRPDTRNLDEDEAWNVRLAALRQAAEGVGHFYDSLIVDEVQDLPGELIGIMHRLTPRLFMAGDANQRIFEKASHDNGITAAHSLARDIVSLRYHYRIGQNICSAADRILPGPEPLITTCRYSSPLGSRVEAHSISGLDAQCAELARRLETQLRTYGRGESIGVVASRRETCNQIFAMLQSTPVGSLAKVMSSSSDEPWYDSERPICIMTLQAAKGSEFRAVHWLAADDTPYFTREKAYVIVTRSKTALDVYHTQPLVPVLRSAFSTLQPPKPPF